MTDANQPVIAVFGTVLLRDVLEEATQQPEASILGVTTDSEEEEEDRNRRGAYLRRIGPPKRRFRHDP